MLTARGFWFFVVTSSVLAIALLLGAIQLILVAATLLLWFLSQWLLFHVRIRVAMRRLAVVRSLRTLHGEVTSMWAGQRVDVAVTLVCDSWLGLPYVVATERAPALAQFQDGVLCRDGPIGPERPMALEYVIECKAAGWLRFEGVKVQLADLQGLFTHAAFLRDVREYRVLPRLPSHGPHARFVKLHNILPLLGTHRHARPGGSSELLDLRDYLPGDPPRMIAWKISARRDRLITKELESEVPIRCTVFLDTSNSVRVGPVGETALCRLVEIAAGVAQGNATERDLTGLCLFDESRVTGFVKPGRGGKHLMDLIGRLTGVAGLIPNARGVPVRALVPLAYGLAQDLYPHWLDADVNRFPSWLPWWAPQPTWTIPPGAPRNNWRWSPAYHRDYRRRKQLAAILSVRYGLGPGGLGLLLEDDEHCSRFLQRFLAEHRVAFPFPLYNERGEYCFAAPTKPQVLADALLKRIVHGKDNELFVLCIDVLEDTEHLAPLERAVCVARAKHHQVVVVCPWPAGVEVPGARPHELEGPRDMQVLLQRLCTAQLHRAYTRVQQAFGRVGVNVICAAEDDSISRILQRMRRLRVQERGVR